MQRKCPGNKSNSLSCVSTFFFKITDNQQFWSWLRQTISISFCAHTLLFVLLWSPLITVCSLLVVVMLPWLLPYCRTYARWWHLSWRAFSQRSTHYPSAARPLRQPSCQSTRSSSIYQVRAVYSLTSLIVPTSPVVFPSHYANILSKVYITLLQPPQSSFPHIIPTSSVFFPLLYPQQCFRHSLPTSSVVFPLLYANILSSVFITVCQHPE